MYSVDKSGFKKILLNFYKQIQDSEQLYKKGDIHLDYEQINNILYIGMGGSAIAGDLLHDVLFDQLSVPLSVIRGYSSPHYCNKNTLVIASSYSGNTEETLSALKEASKTEAQIVTITSGGELKKLSEKNGWSHISIPEGYPPRQALGYLFFPLYHLLGNLNLIKEYNPNLKKLAAFAKEAAQRNDYPKYDGRVFSKDLARTIHNHIPLFYSTAPYLCTVSRRWQNQMQENGKSIAFSNVLPELNHNEIVGWEQDTPALENFIVVFLENEKPHPRIKKRIKLSQKIIKKHGVKVVDIYSAGDTVLEKVFSLIICGDWVSYYLALDYKKDPLEIKNIDYLKKEMASSAK